MKTKIKDIQAEIKKRGKRWRAKENKFTGLSNDEIRRRLLGALPPEDEPGEPK